MKYLSNVSRLTVARSFIALLFVVAGVQELLTFNDTVTFVSSLGLPLATIVTVIVLIIHLPVAIAFAYGYKVRKMGWILFAFTALTIVFVHRDLTIILNVVNTLKNIAIMGGILAIINCCGCERCVHGIHHEE
jgi:putative oxidoreductase